MMLRRARKKERIKHKIQTQVYRFTTNVSERRNNLTPLFFVIT